MDRGGHMSTLEELRARIHTMVDQEFDAWGREQQPQREDAEITLVAGTPLDRPLSHKWPDGIVETFSLGRHFSGTVAGERIFLLVVRADRPRLTWGRERRRAVTFLLRSEWSADRYPLSEWVETDSGEMSTGIPNPARPRSLLKQGDNAPAWLDGWTVRRADHIFESMADGPSLRVVVGIDDDEGMAVFGVRVGLLRGRISPSEGRQPPEW
jgi:hypothetical protein